MFITQLLEVDLVATYLMINILYIKIASRIDKKFATETKVNHIVLEIIKIMWVDS